MFSKLGQMISDLFTKKKLGRDILEGLEETLILSDISAGVAAKISALVSKKRFDKDVDEKTVKTYLAEVIAELLSGSEKEILLNKKPFVFLMSGVNGAGKTTSIAKLAALYQKMGKKVLIAAGDTFRAAAVEQLEIWAGRANVDFISAPIGSDPASLAYDALKKAMAENYDVLFIDTAGRLQNKEGLMAELSKIHRTLKKLDETAPHESVMVLDATSGQNALSQLEHFLNTAGITSLIITKLDGSSKGGVLISLFDKFKIPISFIGTGEKITDIAPFSAKSFACDIVDLG